SSLGMEDRLDQRIRVEEIMNRSLRVLTTLTALLAGSLAHAADKPNLNAYATASPAAPFAGALAKARAEAAFGVVSSMDTQRGVPTFFWAPPNGPRPPAALLSTPESWARFYLDHYAPLYGLSQEALRTATVATIHDTGRGGIIVALRQKVDGIEVLRNDVKLIMKRDGGLVAISGNLHPSATAKTKLGLSFKIAR